MSFDHGEDDDDGGDNDDYQIMAKAIQWCR